MALGTYRLLRVLSLDAFANTKGKARSWSWRWTIGLGVLMAGGWNRRWSEADPHQGKPELDIAKLRCKYPRDGAILKPAVVVSCGSFDPPTIMHLRMFELAKDELLKRGYDMMGGYISPVHDGYGKAGLGLAKHRVEMCKLAVGSSPLIMVDEREAKHPTYQRTRQVLDYIEADLSHHFLGAATHVSTKVLLLCGEDLLESMSTPGVWKPQDVASILEHNGLVCLIRSGSNHIEQINEESHILHKYKENIIPVQDPFENSISSSAVRDLLHSGRSVRYIVPDSVLEYIHKNELYS